MPKQTKAEKDLDKKIERIYYANCSGVQIPVLKMSAVFKAGRDAALAGQDDAGITKAVVDFVETIRTN